MNQRILPYVLILPVTLFLCLFFVYPFVLVSQQAFTTDAGFSLDNFREVFDYWKFPIALKNTLLLAAAVVPIQLALALLMATMVNKMQRGRDLVLYVWTIPLGISDLAAGIIAVRNRCAIIVHRIVDFRPPAPGSPQISASDPANAWCSHAGGLRKGSPFRRPPAADRGA